jgi:pimeloyl-ACP methyl ester carboxylesterase
MLQSRMSHSRRSLLQSAIVAGVALGERHALGQSQSQSQSQSKPQSVTAPVAKSIETPILNIGYEESGDPQGFPIVLPHGFPDDVRAWDDVAPPLATAGHRVLVPYLRGYGPTRFRDASSPRMAEQAAIGQDLVDFADALNLPRFAVAGYDWGGRAAGIAAALRPDRVRAVVLIAGYSIQNVFAGLQPGPPDAEKRIWYQWYFNTERGRAGLKANRGSLCKGLWQEWSPTWHFTDETYNRTALSFDNPDFVDVVIHSYRHRLGNAPGEPRFLAVEQQLAKRPKIDVPAIVLHGADDYLDRAPAELPPAERASFTSLIARRIVAGSGHFMPREKPEAVASAMLEVLAGTSK